MRKGTGGVRLEQGQAEQAAGGALEEVAARDAQGRTQAQLSHDVSVLLVFSLAKAECVREDKSRKQSTQIAAVIVSYPM